MASRDIYVAKKTFLAEVDGKRVRLVAGKTFVRDGHELLNGREHLFVKVEPHYEVEVKRPAKAPKKKPEPELVEATTMVDPEPVFLEVPASPDEDDE